MKKRKAHTGKGHTLYDDQLPESPEEVWVLVAESCCEISLTLLEEESYANKVMFSLGGYDHHTPRGGVSLVPEGFVRYSIELYKILYASKEVHALIAEMLKDMRRLWVRVECAPYQLPLFYEEGLLEQRFELMERIRKKAGCGDVIGLGLEGFKFRRIATYTPKRSDEISRAHRLLEKDPLLLRLLKKSVDAIHSDS